MKEIPLTRGQVAIVDADKYDYLMQWKWYAQDSKRGFYAARRQREPDGSSKLIYMHRHLNSTPEGLMTDHINGMTLDNRIANLRSATPTENLRNQRLQVRKKPKSSKYKGVCWDKATKKWRAMIRVNGKLVNIGRFECEKEAAAAYSGLAKSEFQQFYRQD